MGNRLKKTAGFLILTLLLLSSAYMGTPAPKQVSAAGTSDMYSKLREDGKTISKSQNVTVVGQSVTEKVPQEYSAYMRRKDSYYNVNQRYSMEADFNASKYDADQIGPLNSEAAASGNSFILNDAKKAKLSTVYEKCSYYNGEWLDVKLTVVDWSSKKSVRNPAEDKAIMCFSKAQPGIFAVWCPWIELKYEFFKAGTETKVAVKGYSTWEDIDYSQGIVLKSGFTGTVYINNAADDVLGFNKTSAGNDYYYDRTDEACSHKSKAHWITALFSGDTLVARYTFLRDSDASQYYTCSGYIGNDSEKLVPGPVSIYKRVSDNDEKQKTEDTLNLEPEPRKENFAYTVAVNVPVECDETYYKSFAMTDEVDKGVAVNSAGLRAVNEEGTDRTAWFTVGVDTENKVTFSAAASVLSQETFYGHTYFFEIPVCIKDDTDLTSAAYWNSGRQMAQIKNKSKIECSAGSIDSNEVVTYVPVRLPPKGLRIVKTEDGTGWPLSGVAFDIYEWNGNGYGEIPVDTLSETEDGVYTNTKSLPYSQENQGKYKVVETRSAVDHLNEGWEQEFTVTGTVTEFVYDVSNEPMNPSISIAKLADRTTGVSLENGRYKGEKVPGWYDLGEAVTYHLLARNSGNVTVKDLTVTELMSEDLKAAIEVESAAFVVDPEVKTEKGEDVTVAVDEEDPLKLSISSLIPGDSVALAFTVKLKKSAGAEQNLLALGNTVKVGGYYDNGEEDREVPEDEDDTDEDKINVYHPLISVEKLADRTVTGEDGSKMPGEYDFGDTVSYRVTVKNDGNTDVRNILVKDVLGDELKTLAAMKKVRFVTDETAVTEKGETIGVQRNKNLSVTVEKLAPGDSVVLKIDIVLKSDTAAKGKVKLKNLKNTVSIAATYGDHSKFVPEDGDDRDEDAIDIAYGRIRVIKTSSGTDETLRGAVFEIRDRRGKTIDTVRTKKNGAARSRRLARGTYVLVETKAPSGYKINSKKYKVVLQKSGETVEVSVRDDPKPDEEDSHPKEINEKNAPKTGDTTRTTPYLAFMLLSAFCAGFCVLRRRGRRKHRS